MEMMNDALKLKIINRILSLKDTHTLKIIEKSLEDVELNKDVINKLNKPMRKSIDVEQLKKEQNYKPVNKKEFFRKIKELNIEEPLEELLGMI